MDFSVFWIHFLSRYLSATAMIALKSVYERLQQEPDKLAHQIGAGYIKEPVGANGEYQISHTGTVFLIDPQIRLYAGFPLPHLPETIVRQYLLIRSL